jgi:integrase/recombinase XerD
MRRVIVGRGHVSGALAEQADGFREELLGRGYTEGSAARLMHLMAHLSRWMDACALPPDELTSEMVARFVEARRAEGYTGWRSARALAPLLEYLRGVGVVPAELQATRTVVDEVIGDFETYLVRERGLASASVRSYLGVARRFLNELPDGEGDVLADVTAAAVSGFVRRACTGCAPAWASMIAKGVRSLLRFLYLENKVPVLLVDAVVSPAGWQLTGLPRSIGAGQATALVLSCERGTPSGRRDFAILTVLVRLGLRAGEVVRLGLDDIDWHQGEILVRGKGRRLDRLPLPADVGEALVEWLRDGRPRRGTAREVFTRLRAPDGPLTPGAVSAVVRRACDRVGLPRVGAHRLRHTAAVGMLRGGANLGEVRLVLRQQRPQTTAVYAKVDLVALAELARPWPGARP